MLAQVDVGVAKNDVGWCWCFGSFLRHMMFLTFCFHYLCRLLVLMT